MLAKLSPPETRTGTVLEVVVPLPSSPTPPEPQQYPAPLVATPQLWAYPAMTLAKVSVPATARGVVAMAVPLPRALSPQQYPAPPVVTPQVWVRPAPSPAKPSPPATWTGTSLWLPPPVPSWPLRLSPQHQVAPPLVSPQE